MVRNFSLVKIYWPQIFYNFIKSLVTTRIYYTDFFIIITPLTTLGTTIGTTQRYQEHYAH